MKSTELKSISELDFEVIRSAYMKVYSTLERFLESTFEKAYKKKFDPAEFQTKKKKRRITDLESCRSYAERTLDFEPLFELLKDVYYAKYRKEHIDNILLQECGQQNKYFKDLWWISHLMGEGWYLGSKYFSAYSSCFERMVSSILQQYSATLDVFIWENPTLKTDLKYFNKRVYRDDQRGPVYHMTIQAAINEFALLSDILKNIEYTGILYQIDVLHQHNQWDNYKPTPHNGMNTTLCLGMFENKKERGMLMRLKEKKVETEPDYESEFYPRSGVDELALDGNTQILLGYFHQHILGDYSEAFWSDHKVIQYGEDRKEDVNWHPLSMFKPTAPFMFSHELEAAKQLFNKTAEESNGRVKFNFIEKSYTPIVEQ